MARAYFSLFLVFLMLIFYYTAVNAQGEIEPVEVTATTGPTYVLAGEVEYTLKFWNVGAQHSDSQYSRATLETRCLSAEGGWSCTDIDEVKEGIFSGGPNGTFSFGEASFKLDNGETAIVPSQDFALTFTVQNPQAFAEWDDAKVEIGDVLPQLEKQMGEVSYSGVESGGWMEWVSGKDVGVKFPVSSELETGAGKAVIGYPDGSRVILLDNSKIRFTNDGVYMERGSAYLNIMEQTESFRLQDSRANYVILGTKIYWDTDETKTIFDLMEGVVEIDRLSPEGGEITLVTGESVVVTNEGFTEIQNFEVEQRLNAMKTIDEGIVDEDNQTFPVGYVIVGVVVLIGLFGGYLWLGKNN